MPIRIFKIGGLERKLLAYFILIALAALMIGVEFVLELNSVQMKKELWEKMKGARGEASFSEDSSAFDPIERLRNKIIIMFGVLTVVVGIVLIMFIRNITTPLQHMVDAAEKINRGDLSRIITVEMGDEIGQLGIAMNELTSNLQEITAYTKSWSKQVLAKIERLRDEVCGLEKAILEVKALEGRKESVQIVREEAARLEKDLKMLLDITDSFVLLQAKVDDEKRE